MAAGPQVRQIPAPPGPGRVETGAVQFGDDWPGLFIRGDDAFDLMLRLRRLQELLAGNPDGEVAFTLANLMYLANLVDDDVVVH